MMHEVRSIPPAPRRIRLQPLLAHRWPLLAVGSVLAVAGCLLAWLMFLQAGGKPSDQRRLEAGPTERVTGTVDGVAPGGLWDGKLHDRLSYHFTIATRTLIGESFCISDEHAKGSTVDVDVLVAAPQINRIVGGRLHPEHVALQPRFWLGLFAIPGALLLLGWLAGAFQLRQVLVHGDVSVGRLCGIDTVAYVLPQMLRVTYEFRDHRATARRNRHWVRAHGQLGARLARQMANGDFEPMPVLHDRRLPQWSRLVLPGDFLSSPATPAMPANGTL